MTKIQTLHGSVNITYGGPMPSQHDVWATLTNPHGEKVPLFPWMPADFSAVDSMEFERELSTQLSQETAEGHEFWRQVEACYKASQASTLRFRAAIEEW